AAGRLLLAAPAGRHFRRLPRRQRRGHRKPAAAGLGTGGVDAGRAPHGAFPVKLHAGPAPHLRVLVETKFAGFFHFGFGLHVVLPHRAGPLRAGHGRQCAGGGFVLGDQLLAARLGHFLPMAAKQCPFQRIEQVEAGLEAGAAHLDEGADRTGRGQVLGAAQAYLAQPCRALGADVAQLQRAHFKAPTNAPTMASSPAWSSASKRAGTGLSMSSTPTGLPSWNSGTTSPEREAESQAIWPGKALTSSTRWVWPLLAAAPHTPLCSGMRTQAGRPWNGPT